MDGNAWFLRGLRRIVMASMTASLLIGAVGCGQSGGGTPAPAGTPEAGGGEPVVVIDGKAVTRKEYEAILFDKFGTNFLEQFVEDRLVEQKAEALGVKVDEAELKASVDKDVDALLKTRFNGNLDAMRDALQERGMSLEGWRSDLAERKRREQLIDKMIKQQRGAESEAVKQRFEQKYGEEGKKFRVRHILVSTKVINSRFYTKEEYDKEVGKIEEETKKLSNEVLGKLRGGGDFGKLAEQHSDDFTASRGGDLGESWRGRFGKEVDDAVDKLEPGKAPVLVKGRRGYHIIEVTEVKEGVEYHGSALLIGNGPTGPGDLRSREERDAEAQKKLDAVKAALAEGKPFADVAREFSEDVATKARGGELGAFGRRRLGDEVDVVLDQVKPPTVTDPISTPRGFWIVKLDDRRSVDAKDKKVVRHIFLSTEYDDVKKRKLTTNLETLARDRAAELLKQLQGGADFAKLAEEFSEDAYTRKTGGEYLNFRQSSLGPEIWEAIQTMEANGAAKIVESKRGFHIVQLVERTVTRLEDVQKELLAELNDQPVNPSEQRQFVKTLKDTAKIDRKIGAAPVEPKVAPADATHQKLPPRAEKAEGVAPTPPPAGAGGAEPAGAPAPIVKPGPP